MAEPGSGSCSTVFGVVAVAQVSRAAAGDGGTPRQTVAGLSVSHGNALASCRSPQPALPGIHAPAGATGASARAPQERRPAFMACRTSARDGIRLSRIQLSFRSGATPSHDEPGTSLLEARRSTRELEHNCFRLDDGGCKVGIGIAGRAERKRLTDSGD